MMRHRIQSAGFTLVEVMLTTVLAAVLLLALWSLLSMYSKTFEGGHARTEQSQLARVLLEQMSTDFENVLVAPTTELPAAMPSSGVGLDAVSTLGDQPPAHPIAPVHGNVPAAASLPQQPQPFATGNGGLTGLLTDRVPAPDGGERLSGSNAVVTSSLRPAGLFGTATFLQMDVVQPATLAPDRERDEQLVDPESSPRADELKTVVYAFEEYRDPANPSREPTTRLVRSELSWAQAHPARGVERGDFATGGALAPHSALDGSTTGASDHTEGFGAPIVDSLGADDESLPPSATTIPEVLGFALRYFDGAMWSEEWDSVSRKSLPTAIEVSLRLRSLEEIAKPTTDDLASKAGVDQEKVAQWKHPVQRLLIPLPLAPKPGGVRDVPHAPGPDGGRSLLGAETHARFDRQ